MEKKDIGWWVADEGGWFHCPQASSAEEALDDFFFSGDWPEMERPYRVRARAVLINEDGEEVEMQCGVHYVDAYEPECSEEEHDWQSPVEVVGGLKENPGVFGHGGGVRIREVCRHCGRYRVTDTWYQDTATGEVWDTDAVWYEDADETSERWRLSEEE